MIENYNVLSANEALHRIEQNLPIDQALIEEDLDILKIGLEIKNDVVIRNSKVNKFIAPSVEFHGKVIFESTLFNYCIFNYTYFTGGLTITNSIVQQYLDFEAGLHNKKDALISNSIFKGFVNFFDCWFMSRLILKDNTFLYGSNLLGNLNEPYSCRFDSEVVLENNIGRLDLDGEGNKDYNMIDFGDEV